MIQGRLFKCLIVFVMACCMCIGFSDMALAARGYWNGDENYPCVDGGGGAYVFMDVSSVKVDEYNPPIYQIEADCIITNDNSFNEPMGRTFHQVSRYNYDKQTVWKQNEKGIWCWIDRKGAMVEIHKLQPALAMFKAAYGIEFFH